MRSESLLCFWFTYLRFETRRKAFEIISHIFNSSVKSVFNINCQLLYLEGSRCMSLYILLQPHSSWHWIQTSPEIWKNEALFLAADKSLPWDCQMWRPLELLSDSRPSSRQTACLPSCISCRLCCGHWRNCTWTSSWHMRSLWCTSHCNPFYFDTCEKRKLTKFKIHFL